MSEKEPRFAVEPEQVIIEAVRAVEPQLDAVLVKKVLLATLQRRPARREVARFLEAGPELLTSGRPEGPTSLGRLLRALRENGAIHVQLPRCTRCGARRPLKIRHDQTRICASCLARVIAVANPCALCGSRNYSGRDRDGRPRCSAHPPDDGRDVLADLVGLVTATAQLPPDVVEQAVCSVERSKTGRLRLLWALEDHPRLLTGDGAHGPARGLRLIQALIARGADHLVDPPCPFCHRTTTLDMGRDGLRCCRTCWKKVRAQPCSQCARSSPVATRTPDGLPLCANCCRTTPFHQRICVRCGELRRAVQRTADGPLCSHCFQLPTAACSLCNTTRPCHFAQSATPVCGPCQIKARPPKECSRCGLLRRAEYRTEAGEPLCGRCGVPRIPCSQCSRSRRVVGRTGEGEPLCDTCWNRHERVRRPCSGCGVVEKLFHYGLCPACAARRQLSLALTDPPSAEEAVRPELEPVYAALLQVTPHALLAWLRLGSARHILHQFAQDTGPVSHEVLDGCQPVKVVRHLRAVLVAGGALPRRDEHLAELELWLGRAYARLSSAEERNALRSFVTWHHLHRLRRQGKPVTQGQAEGVRHEVSANVRLLSWLAHQGRDLSSCTQDHIDAWLAEGSANRTLIRSFMMWAARRALAPPLHVPFPISAFSAEVIAQDLRWDLVRRLARDEGLGDVDRAAGLLVLLFAQPPSRIIQLTCEHVTDTGEKVSVLLGKVPADMPAPLDELVRRLVRRRRGHSAVRLADEPSWLLPGGHAGRPMAAAHLSNRLKQIGIRPRAARHTALMDIAAELPAVVVSRLLGFHQNTADQWHRESRGFSPDYAADLSRR
ncbi:hypothetical protein [Streptomyces sp. H27-C3]|uniref:hypothetical protein n=1 Tax=Streptomyces sp. H27-C3 TaxID=3046305 RepID=UPI0024B89D55|nr:hypothetical protein [Streptomyces sp. H27-C3]MDJ0464663.1 hypothetical protein [Streptomyces sp. H27-C3]